MPFCVLFHWLEWTLYTLGKGLTQNGHRCDAVTTWQKRNEGQQRTWFCSGWNIRCFTEEKRAPCRETSWRHESRPKQRQKTKLFARGLRESWRGEMNGRRRVSATPRTSFCSDVYSFCEFDLLRCSASLQKQITTNPLSIYRQLLLLLTVCEKILRPPLRAEAAGDLFRSSSVAAAAAGALRGQLPPRNKIQKYLKFGLDVFATQIWSFLIVREMKVWPQIHLWKVNLLWTISNSGQFTGFPNVEGNQNKKNNNFLIHCSFHCEEIRSGPQRGESSDVRSVSKCNRRPAEGPYGTEIKSRITDEKRSQKVLIDAREAVRKTCCGFIAQLFKEQQRATRRPNDTEKIKDI